MSPPSLGRSQDDVRRHNLSAVLRLVHERGAASRVELVGALGLNRSTVGDLVGSLAAVQLVREEPDAAGPGRVGRPSLVVHPVGGSVHVVAAYVDVHRLDVVRVELGGRVVQRLSEPLPEAPGLAATVERLAELVVRSSAQAGGELVGVGVAVPGTVHSVDGTVGLAPNLGWVEQPLGTALSTALAERLGRPVRVDVANDADLGVLAEHLRGAARASTDAIYLCGTWGLGGGVISGGHQLTGSRGYAGEVGHLGVDPDGRACHCGSRGCWESESQAAAWAAPLDLDATAPDVSRRVLARLAAGGVAARRTRDRLSRSFARGVASLVNVFDPDVVILGAGLWKDLWPEVEDDVVPWVSRLVLPALRDQVVIVPAGLGEESTLVGAAELAFQPLLADPLGRLVEARERVASSPA